MSSGSFIPSPASASARKRIRAYQEQRNYLTFEMEITSMKLIGLITTAILSLTIGAAPVFAQQEQHEQEEQKAKPAQEEKKAQPEKAAKQDAPKAKPAQQAEKKAQPE